MSESDDRPAGEGSTDDALQAVAGMADPDPEWVEQALEQLRELTGEEWELPEDGDASVLDLELE